MKVIKLSFTFYFQFKLHEYDSLNLSGTYCHKTSNRPPSCITTQRPTIYITTFTFNKAH